MFLPVPILYLGMVEQVSDVRETCSASQPAAVMVVMAVGIKPGLPAYKPCLLTITPLGCPYKEEEVEHPMRQYRPVRTELLLTDGIVMKGKRTINSFQLQKQILQELHSSHMEIRKIHKAHSI